jgi:CheY-like chemotaxis protein
MPLMTESIPEQGMTLLILVVDDEPDVELLFRQHFRRDLRQGRFTMEFAQSGDIALQRITDAAGVSLILILSDINMPGMTGLELLPKAKAARPDVPVIMITALRVVLRRFSLNPSILERCAAKSTRGSSAPPDRTHLGFNIAQWQKCPKPRKGRFAIRRQRLTAKVRNSKAARDNETSVDAASGNFPGLRSFWRNNQPNRPTRSIARRCV